MAATVSAWAKPGAWALDSEEHEAELLQQEKEAPAVTARYIVGGRREETPLADFPSLAAAASTKTKKKKGQTLSLAEFNNGPAKPVPSRQTLTTEDLLMLPTGPRERTAEELDRSRLGGGFRSYGSNSREESNSRWGSSRASDDTRRQGGFGGDSNRELAPSRADEIDDWTANKKPAFGGSGFERRERGGGERERGERGGFFNSQSRADESDTWVTNKSFVPSEGRRFGSGGGGGGAFDSLRERRGDSGSGVDSDTWGKKPGGAFDSIKDRRGGSFESGLNGGTDSDSWGKKREDVSVGGGGGGRPKLNLQPRTLPVGDVQQNGTEAPAKPKGSNPFGEARPREEVLKEKGQDWKEIDEKLESLKIKEIAADTSFGSGNGRTSLPEGRAERAWRKADSSDANSQSDETIENGHAEEEEAAASRDVQA